MRKLFLFSALAAFAILGCNGSGDMPCVDCGEPFPYSPSSPSGIPNQSGSSSSSSWQQILEDGYCFYAEKKECIYENAYDCRGDYYGSDKTCGNNGKSPPIQISSSSRFDGDLSSPGSSNSDDIPDGPSSPSNASSSSEQSGVIHGQPVRYGEETYETVEIGTQTWMARNLNLYNNFDDNPNGCGIHYDWATAMALNNSCNNTAGCLPTPMGPPKHRGICPEGWHIPSDTDWSILAETVGGSGYLKAFSTWWNGGPGEDKYGFAALPCGYMTGTEFLGFGDFAGWWSSTEDKTKGYVASDWSVDSKTNITQSLDPKSNGRNVRCVKN